MTSDCMDASNRNVAQTPEPDYSLLDRAGAAQKLFFPRPDTSRCPLGATDLRIDVAPGVAIGARFYARDPAFATILYFHGNGEVASDHDDIASAYHGVRANLFVAEFRGYGRSTGTPSFATLPADARAVASHFHAQLNRRGFPGPRFVMGRSLGAHCALEIAARAPQDFRGLVIESGAASLRRIEQLCGTTIGSGDLLAAHEAKIRSIRLPALLIHGELDTLIPLEHAKELYELLQGTTRKLVTIQNAGHNNILWVGHKDYFAAIAAFLAQ